LAGKGPKVKLNRPAKQSSSPGDGASANGFVPLPLLTAGSGYRPDPDDGPPCHLCTARCCKYFALPIDKPTSRADFDHIRWYLMHEGIAVWVEDGDWYLEVRTQCRHLQPDNRCGIYETRPQVCRDYGLPEEGPCEYFTEHLSYDLYFDSDKQLEAWLRKREERRKKRRAERRRARA